MITFKNINERFSEIVGEYLAKGYVINTGTMGGLQGEIAKVDMTDGKKIIRVMLDSRSGGLHEPDNITIKVGRCTDKVRANRKDAFSTIWNDNLEEIHRETFYAVSNYPHNAFGTKEEAERCVAIRRERSRNAEGWITRVDLPPAARKIALSYIHREYYSSYKLSDIERVCKEIVKGRVTYVIRARGREFKLR